MKIKVSGLASAAGRLKKYRDGLAGKMHIFLERLAAVGISTAGVRFEHAQYDGVNDVTVDGAPEWLSDTRLAITARGQAVAFIEFGTGVHYVEEHPKAAELGLERGTYGQGKGSRDLWGYYGEPGTNGKVIRTTERGQVVLTHGNPPARAMYEAGRDMRARISEIAAEVFG